MNFGINTFSENGRKILLSAIFSRNKMKKQFLKAQKKIILK